MKIYSHMVAKTHTRAVTKRLNRIWCVMINNVIVGTGMHKKDCDPLKNELNASKRKMLFVKNLMINRRK